MMDKDVVACKYYVKSDKLFRVIVSAGCLVASREQSEPMLCLDAANPPARYDPTKNHVPIIYPCHGEGTNQNFYYTKRHEIRFLHEVDLCLTYGLGVNLNNGFFFKHY